MVALASLLQAALSLADDDRAELALRLVESLEDTRDRDEDVEAAWTDEIDRRIADLAADRTKPVPLEQALSALRARLRSARG